MHAWSNKTFQASFFMVCKALVKFKKMLSHGNLEPNGSGSYSVIGTK